MNEWSNAVLAYYFSFPYFFSVRAISFHFWPLCCFTERQYQLIQTKRTKRGNIITVETKTTFTTQKTCGYTLQVTSIFRRKTTVFLISIFIFVHGLHHCCNAFILILFQYPTKRYAQDTPFSCIV